MGDHPFLAWLLPSIGILSSLAWCYLRGLGAVSLLRITELDPVPPAGVALPRLSVVIAALNEAETLEPALRSLLAQDYPELEIVLVDDRSTDGTGALMQSIAGHDPRVKVVQVRELPAGWLGKVNALRQGYALTTGDYVLFTDADIRYASGALRAALGLAAAERLDHLALMPRLRGLGFLHTAFMQAGCTSMIRFTGGRRGLTRSRLPVGVGAFNLVRRAAFEVTAGFEWFRMDAVDDMALGKLMRESGGRCGYAVAFRSLEVLIYPSLAAAVRGMEKNLFGGAGCYSAGRTATFIGAFLLISFGPLLLLASPWLWLFPLLALLALVVEAGVGRRRFGWRILPGLAAPAMDLVAMYALGRSAFYCLRQGGIRWRGTLYPLAELRAGQRVSFP